MKIGIIGGGLIGLALGRLISAKGVKVIVFDKDNIASHQSGNNSGVLHCGLHYKPGSLKARLAVQGIREMTNYCIKNSITHESCGKIVVANSQQEIDRLKTLAGRGKLNGLKGLKYLNQKELKEREPHVCAAAALLVPEEGIVDFKQVATSLKKDIQNQDGFVKENCKVVSSKINPQGKTMLTTACGEYEFDLIFNCAGLYSDKIFADFSSTKPDLKVVPFRGEYWSLKPEFSHLVKHLIYPTPNPAFPFLGVHFTRMTSGVREVGPNAVLALKREGYTNKDFNLSEALESVTYPGFIKFLTKNFRFSLEEFISSLTIEGFVKKSKKLIPDIDASMLDQKTAGVRAQSMSRSGKLHMDFEVKRFNNQVHVLNAPSPGATASLAIARYIVEEYTTL
ncbi:hypothetical protein BST97_15550 [Nonlabens spongiae]|uniref:FAD dependent oxidoreductase domain-containing protein n=1 Tax=Nonlabens spongiae TaxID=331648 RepID=A0A1W6MNW9_9FLAO|nr:L-2-hydroxyglutarate oxidase [Nonlabens spongiae]ARN76514.1 hypothetical protein BST97_00010 [Nonlabens spongiae]ARN79285.1 hypothetical protein BST97_15550 [Nonlabens spongiae]